LGRREFRAATHCSTPATLCSTLQHTATTYKARGYQSWDVENSELQHTAAHLQHSAAHCNTLQQLTKQEATRVGTSRIQSCNMLQHTCNTLQHTATHCNNLRSKRLPELGRLEFSIYYVCAYVCEREKKKDRDGEGQCGSDIYKSVQ